MKAVYKHEMATHLTTWNGYVFMVSLLLFAAIFVSNNALKLASPRFEIIMCNVSFVYIIAVPIITMRTYSGERRQKTDQLLYSLPISGTEIVLGKYFALLTLLLIPTVIIAFFPLVLTQFGMINLLLAELSVVGFFLLGAAFLSVGAFISSLTDSQVLAVGITLVLLLLNYFLSNIASYINTAAYVSLIALLIAAVAAGAFLFFMTKNWIVGGAVALVLVSVILITYFIKPSSYANLLMVLLRGCSLYTRYFSIMYSTLRLDNWLIFVSVAAVFQFLTVQAVEKRRWSS